MEDLIKFNDSIEISPDAKKLMLGMIRSMQSLVPSGPALVPQESSVYNPSFLNYFAGEVFRISDENQDIFDGIIDPGILKKYLSITSDFEEIGDQLVKLLKAVREYQHLSGYLSHRLACMMKEHMEMVRPDTCKSLDNALSEINKETASMGPVKQANPNLKVV